MSTPMVASGSSNDGLRVLCFDAGGLQSKASLLILHTIMEKISENVGGPVKPCEFFDLIAGTSSGGLNAIMLGRLGYSTEETIRKYDELGSRIFNEPGSVNRWAANGYSLINEGPLETIFKEMGRAGTDHDQPMLDPEREHHCRCIVTTVPANAPSSPAILIRSYSSSKQRLPFGHKWTIWEALRATSATPVYLAPFDLHGHRFSDACAAGYANPSKEIIDEIKSMPEYHGRRYQCFLTIGTGLKELVHNIPLLVNPRPKNWPMRIIFFLKNLRGAKRRIEGLTRYFVVAATKSKQTNEDLCRMFLESNEMSSYFRFDPPQDLSRITPTDMTRLADIEVVVNDYVSSVAENVRLEECAYKLQFRTYTRALSTFSRMATTGTSSIEGNPDSDRMFRLRFQPLDYKKNRNFMGRVKELEQLAAVLQHTGKIFVLHGIGGMGKTQTALEFAYRFQKDFSSIFWVHAASRRSATASFINIAQRLVAHYAEVQHSRTGHPAYDQIAQELCLSGLITSDGRVSAEEASGERIVDAVKEWLSSEGNNNWLVVFDDHNDLKFDIRTFFPTKERGNMIITSRRTESTRLGTDFEELERLDEENAIKLLIKLSNKKGDKEISEAREIVTTLECLPLAIDQAGAYIAARQFSLSEYLPCYKKQFNTLMAEKPGSYDDYPYTAFTTWNMSLEAIQNENPGAAELLLICGFLSNEDIPDLLVHHGRNRPENDKTTEKELISIFSYSLARRNELPGSFRIHAVVHRWAREQVDVVERRKKAIAAIDLLAAGCTYGSVKATAELLAMALRVVPHIDACLQALTEYFQDDLWSSISVHSRIALADAYRFQGRFYDAEKILDRVLQEQKKVLLPGNPAVLLSTDHLARVYKLQQRHAEAANLFEEVLREREKLLGFNNPATLASANNLGLVYRATHRYTEAEELLQRTLAGREELLGSDAQNTLLTVNNLAFVYDALGQDSKAEELYNRAIEGLRKRFTESHPDTLIAEHNLASLRFKHGEHDRAIEMFKSVLARREKAVGPNNHDTLMTVKELGLAYRSQRKYQLAVELLRRALTGFEQILGRDNLETKAVAGHLTSVLNEQAASQS